MPTGFTMILNLPIVDEKSRKYVAEVITEWNNTPGNRSFTGFTQIVDGVFPVAEVAPDRTREKAYQTLPAIAFVCNSDSAHSGNNDFFQFVLQKCKLVDDDRVAQMTHHT